MSWVKQMFSEGSEVSFARVATAVLIAFVLGWDTAFVVYQLRHGGIPILPDGAVLAAQVAFMGAFYFYNKGAATLTSIKGGSVEPEKTNGGTIEPKS
jgi:hypothetical protein